eukprot:353453-Chlamydomonas_euryale.AAC.3
MHWCGAVHPEERHSIPAIACQENLCGAVSATAHKARSKTVARVCRPERRTQTRACLTVSCSRWHAMWALARLLQ